MTGYITQVRTAPATSRLPAAWRDASPVRPRPTATLPTLARGTRVCARVVAVNAVGRGATSAPTCSVVLADERSLLASKGWARSASRTAYLRTLSTSRRTGSVLSLRRAYGSGIAVAAVALRGGGRLGVYVGARRVAVITLSARRTTPVLRLITVRLTGQRVLLRVESPGSAGVVVDGFAVRP